MQYDHDGIRMVAPYALKQWLTDCKHADIEAVLNEHCLRVEEKVKAMGDRLTYNLLEDYAPRTYQPSATDTTSFSENSIQPHYHEDREEKKVDSLIEDRVASAVSIMQAGSSTLNSALNEVVEVNPTVNTFQLGEDFGAGVVSGLSRGIASEVRDMRQRFGSGIRQGFNNLISNDSTLTGQENLLSAYNEA